ncbi:MAG: hypothetical protein RLZZ399_1258 [Verrucomicrobiota bacterium]|jgi:CHAD domain-containing protein
MGPTTNRRKQPREKYQSHLLSLALDLCDEAIAPIQGPHKDPEPVHRSRVAIKKLRALLRLLRPALAPKKLILLRSNLRKAASTLAPCREVDSLLESVTLLVRKGALSQKESRPLRRAISALADKQPPPEGPTLSKVRSWLRCVRKTLLERPTQLLRQSHIERELKRTYLRAHRLFCAYQSVSPSDAAETLHAWRKLTKRLAYQMRLTAPLRNSLGKRFIRGAEKIGELTGQGRDLTLLAETLDTPPFREHNILAIRAIRKTIPKIRKKAINAGKGIFVRSKKRLFQITGRDDSR